MIPPIPQMKDERVDYLRQKAPVLPSSYQMVPDRNTTGFNPLPVNEMSIFAPPQFNRELDMQQNPRPYVPYANSIGDF